MKTRCAQEIIVGALVVALVVALVAAFTMAATVSGQAAVTGSATYTDPAGDGQPGAPDITTVVISDTVETGMISIAVTATGFDATKGIVVSLDADKSYSTGSHGTDFVLNVGEHVLVRSATGSFWHVERWDGSVPMKDMEQSPTMSFTQTGDVFTWQLNKTDLGGTSGFRFEILTVAFDTRVPNLLRSDIAGTWDYDLTAAPATKRPSGVVEPLIGKPTLTPDTAVAGKRLTVSFPVTRSDTGAPLTSGKMLCDPSVAGKVIRHAEQFKAGKAKLGFLVPKNAKGKLLRVKVKIVNGAQSATKVVTVKVN